MVDDAKQRIFSCTPQAHRGCLKGHISQASTRANISMADQPRTGLSRNPEPFTTTLVEVGIVRCRHLCVVRLCGGHGRRICVGQGRDIRTRCVPGRMVELTPRALTGNLYALGCCAYPGFELPDFGESRK